MWVVEDFRFKTQLFMIHLAYLSSKLWQYINHVLGRNSYGFEEVLDSQLKDTIDRALGYQKKLGLQSNIEAMD